MSIDYAYFCAEAPQITGTFTLWEAGVDIGDFDVTIPANRYFIPDETATSGILKLVVDAAETLSASSGGSYTWVQGSGLIPEPVTSEAYGVRYAVQIQSGGSPAVVAWEWEPQDDNATRIANWLGWSSSIGNRASLPTGSSASNITPLGFWCPFAYLTMEARFNPLQRHGGTSPRTADGTVVGVTYDDGVAGYIRHWRFVPVDYARISSRISVIPDAYSAYLTNAGLDGQTGFGEALDRADGWWDNVCTGGRFYAVERDMPVTNGTLYRIVLSGPDLPCSMAGWLSCGPPNVTPWAPAGDLHAVEFCAVSLDPES